VVTRLPNRIGATLVRNSQYGKAVISFVIKKRRSTPVQDLGSASPLRFLTSPRCAIVRLAWLSSMDDGRLQANCACAPARCNLTSSSAFPRSPCIYMAVTHSPYKTKASQVTKGEKNIPKWPHFCTLPNFSSHPPWMYFVLWMEPLHGVNPAWQEATSGVRLSVFGITGSRLIFRR